MDEYLDIIARCFSVVYVLSVICFGLAYTFEKKRAKTPEQLVDNINERRRFNGVPPIVDKEAAALTIRVSFFIVMFLPIVNTALLVSSFVHRHDR